MRFSFVIPAHNEAVALPATLAALRASTDAAGPGHETIVVDDASTDGTGEIAHLHGATVVAVEKRQIAAVRNAGAAAARGDVLVFIDADTIINPNAVAEARAAIKRGATYGGAPIRFDEPCPLWARALLPAFILSYRLSRIVPGCFFVVTRESFERVGGFDESVYAGEEVIFASALRKAHGRYYLGRTPVVTSGRKLRDYTAFEILGAVARVGLKGKRGVESREGLDLWYEQRQNGAGGRART